jgi:hypothetical protein
MSDIFKKAKALGKAYIDYKKNGLPTEEEYFKERMEICNTCEWNSKFKEDKPKTFIEKGIAALREKLPSEYHCTACGCDIGLKCASKDQTCGLVEKGFEPKWYPIEVFVGTIPGMFVIQPENLGYSLEVRQTRPTLVFKSSSNKLVEFKLILNKPSRYKYKTATVSCGCTVPLLEQEDETTVMFNVRVSTLNFTPGVKTLKSATLFFERNDGKQFHFKVQFEITVSKDGL